MGAEMTDLLTALSVANATALDSRLEEARYFVGIDLGTTNSTLAVVDAQALLEGDKANAVRVLSIRQETENGVTYSPFLASAVAQAGPDEWWVVTDQLKVKFSDHRSKSDLACVS